MIFVLTIINNVNNICKNEKHWSLLITHYSEYKHPQKILNLRWKVVCIWVCKNAWNSRKNYYTGFSGEKKISKQIIQRNSNLLFILLWFSLQVSLPRLAGQHALNHAGVLNHARISTY